MQKYILIIIFIFILFILIYVYNEINKLDQKCYQFDKNENKPNNFSTSNDTLNKTTIDNIIYKSAFNCCCIGNMRNDYVDLCALRNCYYNGVRALDFQIFSLNNNPVVSASVVNQNEYKELYNYLSLSEVCININEYFLKSSRTKNNNEVLFLNFRINSNNIDIYNSIHDILLKNFNNKHQILTKTTMGKPIEKYTLEELRYKIIIMVDLNASPEFNNLFNSTKLSKITLIQFGNGQINHALYENEVVYQEPNFGLSSIYPKKKYRTSNYDYKNKGIKNGFNFIFMNYQKSDNWLKKYNNEFNTYSSFIIKQSK